jgi:uncharacterized repeat protein (TIGR03806 family)
MGDAAVAVVVLAVAVAACKQTPPQLAVPVAVAVGSDVQPGVAPADAASADDVVDAGDAADVPPAIDAPLPLDVPDSVPDSPPADTPLPDTAPPDMPLPDTAPPDMPLPDSPPPDMPLPDSPPADTPLPDTAPPDLSPIDTCPPGGCPKPVLPAGVGSSPCKLDGALPTATAIQLVPWFTKLKATQPIDIKAFPDGTDRLVYVSRPGQIYLFDNQPDVANAKAVLDIGPKVSTAGEGGLLSVAFHPEFKKNRKFYVNYTTSGAKFDTVVAEYTMKAGDPEVADPASWKLVIQIPQPYTNHDGGQLLFDNAGYLLIGMGDGGGGGDPLLAGQNNKMLLGKMLRLDVDKPAGGKNYGIPPDNPFVGNPAYLPEIYATGMRNPWRFSKDRQTGQVWIGDVGQGLWEEIDILHKGANYGWNVMEGTHCYVAAQCNQQGKTLPVAEYGHNLGTSVTGGVVYRGSQQKSLHGAYLFADWGTGRFWSLRANGTGGWTMKELVDTATQPVAFGEDRDGEVYVVQLGGTTIHKIVEAKSEPPVGPAFPQKLSQTGCFADMATLKPAQGLLPYDVRAPLWSDGAAKARWLVLPAGAVPQAGKPGPVQVPQDPIAPWELPVGSLLIKHFALGDAGAQNWGTPVETRFIKKTATGFTFHTYRWNAQGTDADLLPGGGGEVAFQVKVQGQPKSEKWRYPTIGQCETCHKPQGATANQLLGVQSAQLHRERLFATDKGGTMPANQLAAWSQQGLLSDPALDPAKVLQLPEVSEPSQVGAAGTEAMARAYLHANCAGCHRPGASPSDLDLRYTTPWKQSNACGKVAQHGAVGGAAVIVESGKPQSSVLWQRLNAGPASADFMPPLGVAVPHAAAYKLVADWIAALPACP